MKPDFNHGFSTFMAFSGKSVFDADKDLGAFSAPGKQNTSKSRNEQEKGENEKEKEIWKMKQVGKLCLFPNCVLNTLRRKVVHTVVYMLFLILMVQGKR